MSAETSCARVRDALLLAEPAELRGEGPGPVATHVRTCAACRAAARRILEGTQALDEWLGSVGAPPSLEALSALASVGRRPPGRAMPRGRRALAWIGLSVAAAAIAVLVLPPDRPAPVGSGGPTADPEELLPLVQDAEGRSFAVLETDDPNITVLWFF